MVTKYNMDMCEGPLTGKIVRYAIPLVLTYLLQHAFHLADIVVIGRFAESSRSLAAIGTTGDLNALMLNLIWGVSVGANVVVAQCYGAKNHRSLVHAVHTSLALALFFGALVCVAGVLLAPHLLAGINARDEVLAKATLYWRICLCGAPFMLIYNYCCSVLRALGDTRRPLIFLSISGITNVVLNVVLVTLFHLDVAGVALATAFSQMVSAMLVLRVMTRAVGPEKIMFRHVRFYWPEVKRMLHIGVPAGVQGAFFSLSNVIIMAAINTLGHEATAGNIAACQIEGVMYVIVIAMYQTAMAFSGQNYGAGKYVRVRQSVLICTVLLTATILILSAIGLVFGETLLGFITPDRAVVAQAETRLYLTLSSYFMLGFMDLATGGLRGIGRSIFPAVVSLLGACVFRVIWVETAFELPQFHSLRGLLISYPISWGAVALVNGGMFFLAVHFLIRKQRAGEPAETA